MDTKDVPHGAVASVSYYSTTLKTNRRMHVYTPPGCLSITAGDGGAPNDVGRRGHAPEGNGQNLQTLLGKILRIDVNKGTPYAIPSDNPYADGKNGKPEIYAYGLRNPWGLSFDGGGAHELIGTDVGQERWEEINIIVKGGNYGWRSREGFDGFDPRNSRTAPAEVPKVRADGKPLIDPVLVYKTQRGNRPDPDSFGASISGGYIYRGKALPQLAGKYVFGDWSSHMGYADGSLLIATRPEKEGSGERWTAARLPVNEFPDGKLEAFVWALGQGCAKADRWDWSGKGLTNLRNIPLSICFRVSHVRSATRVDGPRRGGGGGTDRGWFGRARGGGALGGADEPTPLLLSGGQGGHRALALFAQDWSPTQRANLRCWFNPRTRRSDAPTENCFYRVLTAVPVLAFPQALWAWQKARHGAADGGVVVWDGKARRGSGRTQLVGAINVGSGRTLGVEPVADKSNEIPAGQTLLDRLDLDGTIALMDALHTQKGPHYPLEVSAGEDRCRVRHPVAATVLGILRRAVQGEARAWIRRQPRARDHTRPTFLAKMSRRIGEVIRLITRPVRL